MNTFPSDLARRAAEAVDPELVARLAQGLVSVRSVTLARSSPTPPPRCAPRRAKPSEIADSSRPAAPRPSIAFTSEARPSRPAGSKRLPASKPRLTSSIGIVSARTK